MVRSSGLGPISSMRLGSIGRKDVRSVKWVWSVLHSQLKAHILLPHRHTYLVLCYFHFYLFATYLLKFFSKTLNSKILKFLMSSNCPRKETAFSHPMEELTQELQVSLRHSEQTDTCWNENMYINASLYYPEIIYKTYIHNLGKAYKVAIRWKLWLVTMVVKQSWFVINVVINDHQWWYWRTRNSRGDGNTHQILPSKSTFVMVIGKQCQRFMVCHCMSLCN